MTGIRQVVAEPGPQPEDGRRAGGRGVEDVVVLERGAAAEVHEQQETVEDALDRLDGVQVGGEPPGRLGGAEGEEPLDRAGRRAGRPPRRARAGPSARAASVKIP